MIDVSTEHLTLKLPNPPVHYLLVALATTFPLDDARWAS
jgi:hypothetical protein